MTVARNVSGYEILTLTQRVPGVYLSEPFTVGGTDSTLPGAVGVGDVLLMVNLTQAAGNPVVGVHLQGSNVTNPATPEDRVWTDRTDVRGGADSLPLRNATVPFARVHAVDGRFQVTISRPHKTLVTDNVSVTLSLTALVFTDQN